ETRTWRFHENPLPTPDCRPGHARPGDLRPPRRRQKIDARRAGRGRRAGRRVPERLPGPGRRRAEEGPRAGGRLPAGQVQVAAGARDPLGERSLPAHRLRQLRPDQGRHRHGAARRGRLRRQHAEVGHADDRQGRHQEDPRGLLRPRSRGGEGRQGRRPGQESSVLRPRDERAGRPDDHHRSQQRAHGPGSRLRALERRGPPLEHEARGLTAPTRPGRRASSSIRESRRYRGRAMRRRSGSLWWAWVMVAGACGGGSPEHGVSSTGGSGGTPAQGGSTGAAGTGGPAGTGGAGAGGLAARRPWPDSTAKTLILADQLPDGLTAAQQQFVVGHLVGTQKLTLAQSQPLRALAPDFLVLHYHLAIWQSAPAVTFIVDGMSWGNDYPTVTMNESWFWHDQSGQRVAATGDDDGLFADSASPDLLQWEAQSPPEPRLAGTGARDTAIAELGGETYVEAWQAFMTDFNAALAATGVPLIPNTGSFTTSWDTTDYSLTAGVFVEGFADPTFAPADWQRSMNQILALVGKHKIVIV